MKNATSPENLNMLGFGWLKESRSVLPGIQWSSIPDLWGASLGIPIFDGIKRLLVASEPLPVFTGILPCFCQEPGFSRSDIAPILLITTGVLMLVARMPPISISRMTKRHADADRQGRDNHD